jgi:hypothetical protein
MYANALCKSTHNPHDRNIFKHMIAQGASFFGFREIKTSAACAPLCRH